MSSVALTVHLIMNIANANNNNNNNNNNDNNDNNNNNVFVGQLLITYSLPGPGRGGGVKLAPPPPV